MAREVGTEGKLGGQADVPGVAGTWKDLTDSVNVMAANLTDQVRGIVKVVTAVANGNLRQKLTVEAKGEVAALAETINNMTDTLATFAEQVTNVAREVGVEGRLGGQANVPGAAGTWKDLTGNVNLLAANLTTQVRAIAEVATAVTKGDLTRSIQVDARGEVAELKDNINTMIDNLRATTDRNQEQDWLKTNLAKFTGMLQGQRDLVTVGKMLLSELAPLVEAQQGAIYQMERGDAAELGETAGRVRCASAPATRRGRRNRSASRSGVGLVGQARWRSSASCSTMCRPTTRASTPAWATRRRRHRGAAGAVRRRDQGRDRAGLAAPVHQHAPGVPRAAYPIDRRGAQHHRSHDADREPAACSRSSSPPSCRRGRSSCSRPTKSWRPRPRQLAEQNVEVERKNKEVEQARRALEEKAAELALTCKYKSEFLANMSHELRTPLNSILILGQQLADNVGGNLTPQADRVRQEHPLRGHRPAHPDQRHPRPVEDRVGHGHGRAGGDHVQLAAGQRPSHLPSRRRDQEPALRRRDRSGAAAARSRATPSACSRSSRTCCPTPSSSPAHGHVAMSVQSRDVRLVARPPGALGGRRRRSPSPSPTPASASRPRSRSSSSRPSSRPTPAPAASTAAPAWAWPSAASWRTCWAARSG